MSPLAVHEKEPPLYTASVIGAASGRMVWLVEQHAHSRTVDWFGLAFGVSSAHVTGLWLPGVLLDHVEVTDVESARPGFRLSATKLELEAFNRNLCAWGADRRTTTAILHPRMMQLVLAGLPFGARLVFHRDSVVLHRSGRALPHRLDSDVEFLCRVADLLPLWLLREASLGLAPLRAKPMRGQPAAGTGK